MTDVPASSPAPDAAAAPADASTVSETPIQGRAPRRTCGTPLRLALLILAGASAVGITAWQAGWLTPKEEGPHTTPLDVAERFVSGLKAAEAPITRLDECMGYRAAYDLLASGWKQRQDWAGFYRDRIFEVRDLGPIVAAERTRTEPVDLKRRRQFAYLLRRGAPYADARDHEVYRLTLQIISEAGEPVVDDWQLEPADLTGTR